MENKLEDRNKYNALYECLVDAHTYLIYGAGVIAYEVCVALKELIGALPMHYIVSEQSNSPMCIEGVPVITPRLLDKEKWRLPIVVATPEVYHEEIETVISHSAQGEIFYIDSYLEYQIMSRYFRKRGMFQLLEDLTFYEADRDREAKKMFSVFMAKSHKDKSLKREYCIPEWICPIQAGKACANQRLATLTDDVGINISNKNANYCELTVTYWVWKNVDVRYKGVCHYRRMLHMEEADIWRCLKNDIDVVLPLPYICYPNAKGQYSRYISEKDRVLLETALQQIAPEYCRMLTRMDTDTYFYNYNMLIAKKEVYDDYCSWLFAILGAIEQYYHETGESARNDRYLGYLGEVLTSLYFLFHQGRLKIAHAEKIWMI